MLLLQLICININHITSEKFKASLHPHQRKNAEKNNYVALITGIKSLLAGTCFDAILQNVCNRQCYTMEKLTYHDTYCDTSPTLLYLKH